MTFAALILALLTTPLQSGLLPWYQAYITSRPSPERCRRTWTFTRDFSACGSSSRRPAYEDATQLHLFYGDAEGTPGSLVTFLAWEDGAPGRAGFGQISEISLSIDPASIGYWLTRAMSFGLRSEGRPMNSASLFCG
jgi:phospholipase/carboxylesterase